MSDFMHRKLLMQGTADGFVHEWLVRFATKPSVVATRYKGKNESPKATIANGEVLVNTQCVIDCWDAYMNDKTKIPSTRKVGHSLRKLAQRVTRRGSAGNRARYYVIDPELIVELSEEMQVGSEERIMANAAQETNDETN